MKKTERIIKKISDLKLQLKSLESELAETTEKEVIKETKLKNKKGIVINIDDKGKEWFIIPRDWIDDFTDEDCTWEIKGEEFTYVERFRTDGDGEWYSVIVQRERDLKFFKFDWGLSHSSGNYFYEERWREVTPKKKTKTAWE